MAKSRGERDDPGDNLAFAIIAGLIAAVPLGRWLYLVWACLVEGEPATAWRWAAFLLLPPPGLFFAFFSLGFLGLSLGLIPTRGPDPEPDEIARLLERAGIVEYAVPNVQPEPGRPRPLYYQFAHRTLRSAAFDNTPTLLRELAAAEDPAAGEFTGLRHQWERARTECNAHYGHGGVDGGEAARTSVRAFRRGPWAVHVVTLPDALRAVEACMVAVVTHADDPREFMQPSPRTRYATVERMAEGGAVLCEWLADGDRVNHGYYVPPEPAHFAEAVFALLLGLPTEGGGEVDAEAPAGATAAAPPAEPDRTTPHRPALGGAVPEAIPGYELFGEIARGGMGVVLAAREVALDREVAIKLPLAAGPAAGDALARFRDESRITARLPHPGVPPVHALGALDDGRPFLVMKLVRGRTLAALLDAPSHSPGGWPAWETVVEELCRTVGFAHGRGVVHRDLKPANVMVGQFGEVQVMDWGLAKELNAPDATWSAGRAAGGAAGGAADRTVAGAVLGTPAYMAPEQARGEPVDARADVFALGAILCQILTGAPPYGPGSAIEVLTRAASGDLGDAARRLRACGVDPQVVAIAARCLALDRAARPADAATLAAELTALREGRGQAAQKQLIADAERKAERIEATARRNGEANWGYAYWGGAIAVGVVVAVLKGGCREASREMRRTSGGGPVPTLTWPSSRTPPTRSRPRFGAVPAATAPTSPAPAGPRGYPPP